METKSICIYCGCGCRLRYSTKKNTLIKVSGDLDDDISEGKPCLKALTIPEVVDKGRIRNPLIKTKNGFKKVSWKEAYSYIYEKTKDLAPEEIAFVPSGKLTNEDCFVFQKFARIVFKTNNVDGCCSRLCHVATVMALKDQFGNDSNLWHIKDIYDTDCLLIVGSNPFTNYPVLFRKILKAKQKGMKIISVQSIENETSKFANCTVLIKPGTEIVFLNGMINKLISKKVSKDVKRIENFDELKKCVKAYTVDFVCKVCRINKKKFLEAFSLIEKSKKFGAMHGMGLTQHTNSVGKVHSLLNLLILKKGKLLSCRGEVNVQGVSDVGCVPDFFIEPDKKEKAERIWKVKLSEERGLTITESFLISPVKAAFVAGFNPAQSLPNLDEVHKNLKKIFLVQLDSYFNLTSEFADVILPIPLLIEEKGTITNGERRIRLVKKVLNADWTKPVWKIMKELATVFGFKKHFSYKNEKEIFYEICKIISAYRKIDVEKVYSGIDQFADKQKRFCRFIPEEFEGTEEITSKKYPFLLTTFRSRWHFLSSEVTSKSKTLSRFSKPFFFLNPEDASKLDIKDDDVIEVSSRVSSIKGKAKVDCKMPKGMVGAHFHFKELLVNKLFPLEFDRRTLTPNFKLVAVNVKKAI